MEDRVARAVELFKSGFNCSQSVVAAFADLYGLTEEQALKVSASFGGGIGRMRETCGAACGMFLLAGLQFGTTDPKDAEGKGENYRIVQELAEKFKGENGFLKCRDLLGLDKDAKESHKPAERNASYYAKRPCVQIVESAARIWAAKLQELQKGE
ncbi:MAG: C_GCAxxG_C_C family protein [Paludibacteraceae bacterium]|nr:C_GCAxxG_C_C family protein [Paludibacteraceae bacterium]